MPRSIAIARMILLIVAASYLLSAVILGIIRAKGETVPGWVIGGWLVTGALGVVLATMLAPGMPAVWFSLLIVLAPWMIYSLVGDLRLGHWIVAVTDAAALGAIGYSLTIVWRDVMG